MANEECFEFFSCDLFFGKFEFVLLSSLVFKRLLYLVHGLCCAFAAICLFTNLKKLKNKSIEH